MRKEWDKRVALSKEKVLSAGVKVIENPDLSLFTDAMAPVYKKFVTTEKMHGLLKRIQATQDASVL